MQTTPQAPVTAQELVAAGRLGTAVKKAHLLCSVTGAGSETVQSSHSSALTTQLSSGNFDDMQTSSWGAVDFYSLTWAGFGT